jgi:hypothetical protein
LFFYDGGGSIDGKWRSLELKAGSTNCVVEPKGFVDGRLYVNGKKDEF